MAPFEDYIDLLQPQFALTPDNALTLAIPQTQSVRIRELRELLVALQLAFPVTSHAETATTTTTADATTSTSTETQGSTSPAAPVTSLPDAVQRSLASLTALDAANLQPDSMLKYRAATALYQEVKLLNTYVREAAVSTDTAPYIVRQLVTVLPSARRTPYDVQLTLAFFGDDARPLRYTLYAGQTDEATHGDDSCEGKPVNVIPLFVTDSVETSLVQSDRSGVRQLGFSAGGASTAVGFGAGVNSKRESEEESASHELNSLLTVGRAADNALTMRVGAAFVERTYALVPRTFNVTALVLVPAARWPSVDATVLPCRGVRYALDFEFTGASDGVKLPRTPRSKLAASLERIIGTGLPTDALLDAAIANDFSAFRKNLAGFEPDEVQRLWTQCVSVAASSGSGGGSFGLPPRQVGFFSTDTTWTRNRESVTESARNALLDNGNTAVLRVGGAYGLADGTVDGKIRFKTANHHDVELIASSVKLEGGGRAATVTFPSVLKIDSDVSEATVTLLHTPLLQRWTRPGDVNAWHVVLPVISVKSEPDKKPAPQFEVVTSSDQLRVTPAGQGQVAVTFKRDKDPTLPFTTVFFSLYGGHITAATPPLTTGQGAYKATVDTIYTLSLGGLVPGSKLRLESWRLEAKADGKPGETAAVAAPAVILYVVGPEPTKE